MGLKVKIQELAENISRELINPSLSPAQARASMQLLIRLTLKEKAKSIFLETRSTLLHNVARIYTLC